MFGTKTGETRSANSSTAAHVEAKNPQATRETVESIVVAVILAFLFRAFIAEAFVIPTGSMAPTLQGRHMDVWCSQCGYQYRTGASGENPDSFQRHEVTHTTCPICRFTMTLQKDERPNQRSFNGDRILVSKFAYVFRDPRRWDVIVFKYPGNAKQNYIKRLVGLPGESLRIRNGDVYTLSGGAYHITHKPPDKVQAMLQLVHDTAYVSAALQEIRWPARWQPAATRSGTWQAAADGKSWTVEGGDRDSWLLYHHVVAWQEDWAQIQEGRLPERIDGYDGQLITDYYEYNDNDNGSNYYSPYSDSPGLHWVGDLAVDCDVRVDGPQGELLLQLVEGGTRYTCRIDVASGRAALSMEGNPGSSFDQAGKEGGPTAQTPIRAAGHYRVQLANVDDQILLWVNRRLMQFDSPTTFQSPARVTPRWSPQEPGDLAPIRIGSRQAKLTVNRLRVLRDVYYIAVEAGSGSEYSDNVLSYDIQQIMASPEQWAQTSLFDSRRSVTFELAEDQFFPMGDNSPQSKDARLWSQGSRLTGYHDPPPYVDRTLLIGKALLIYWPHAWRGPFGLPLLPNFNRMGLIH